MVDVDLLLTSNYSFLFLHCNLIIVCESYSLKIINLNFTVFSHVVVFLMQIKTQQQTHYYNIGRRIDGAFIGFISNTHFLIFFRQQSCIQLMQTQVNINIFIRLFRHVVVSLDYFYIE